MNVIDNRECGVAEDDQVVGMKDGWQMKRLVDVATLQRGFDLPTQERTSGFVPLVTSSGITDTVHKSAVQGPGVATGRSGSIGKVFYIDQDFWPLNTVLYVKDFHGNDPRFIFYLLRNFDLNRFATGTGVPTLNRNFVHDEIVNVPSLPEQQRIVALLDEAFAGLATAKANAERNLQNARVIFESHLQYLFTPRDGEGWATMQLGDVCDFKGGSQPPKSQFVYEARPGYVRFLQIRDYASEKHVTYIPETAKNRLCNSGDIMIGRYGASVGKILTGLAGAYNVALIKTMPDLRLLDRTFFFHYLRSGAFQQRLADVASRSAQDGFGKDDIYGFPVPVPSLNDQQTVIQQLEPLSVETQRLTRLYERKLSALEELKKSLLHQAFNGEL